MPHKKQRPLERSEGVDRDASIIVIACEDKYAPKVYFGQFVTSRVQFKVLSTEDCRSSPDQIVQRLRTSKTSSNWVAVINCGISVTSITGQNRITSRTSPWH